MALSFASANRMYRIQVSDSGTPQLQEGESRMSSLSRRACYKQATRYAPRAVRYQDVKVNANQATSPTVAPTHGPPKPSNATVVKDWVTSRPTAQRCDLAVPAPAAAATLAVSRVTLHELVPAQALLALDAFPVHLEAVTPAAFAAATLELVRLPATSAVVPTTMPVAARRRR
ncbi:gig suppressor [Coniosporium apollinis]|uniref:Gig suppressor n=1 Tax=Coniosporium apollinis TaxID=61459 RepID=A0ABQ9NH25_9PEZI|nr:gig suppressor [Coniosporium apollinis]